MYQENLFYYQWKTFVSRADIATLDINLQFIFQHIPHLDKSVTVLVQRQKANVHYHTQFCKQDFCCNHFKGLADSTNSGYGAIVCRFDRVWLIRLLAVRRILLHTGH